MDRVKKGVVTHQERMFGGGDGDDPLPTRLRVKVDLEQGMPLQFELPIEEAPEWYVGRKVKLKLQADD